MAPEVKGAIMRSPIKIILVVALLSCAAAIGLLRVQGQGSYNSGRGGASAAALRLRPSEGSAVQITDGSFALKNPLLTKMTDSTLLNGKVVNKTKRTRGQVTFEVRAYGSDGRILKGLESKTIFALRELKAGASVPINYGYGVWLQGIPAEKIARIEISETGTEAGSTTLARRIPLAGHALDLKRYAEIEE
jgi:hypothetical protein